MEEKNVIKFKKEEFSIREYVKNSLGKGKISEVRVEYAPVGEKIIVSTNKPGLVIGRGGEKINELTQNLKKKFNLENPQIEISEVENPMLDAQIVAERIASTLERFGLQKFKGIGHKTLGDVMKAGALGVEIIISGKIPSSRARSWRFYSGYLKKCGDIAVSEVKKAIATANLKTGTVGVKVSIMPPGINLPDDVSLKKEELIEEPQEKDMPVQKAEPKEENKK